MDDQLLKFARGKLNWAFDDVAAGIASPKDPDLYREALLTVRADLLNCDHAVCSGDCWCLCHVESRIQALTIFAALRTTWWTARHDGWPCAIGLFVFVLKVKLNHRGGGS